MYWVFDSLLASNIISQYKFLISIDKAVQLSLEYSLSMLNAETLAKLQKRRSNRHRIEPLYLQDEILKSGVKKFFSPFFLRQKKLLSTTCGPRQNNTNNY